ncbi:hypothetical protein HNY73_000946 [Argiope bruennichi]|uniref:Peptidase aspartic putative domain-containing protein n=1 Tax=Argiope bruennichi TaxID=94029 RepID=A0A8T0FZR5_ARGBR|nr:hypothetical protein HNY73_000946 [Argiope bruennichi]
METTTCYERGYISYMFGFTNLLICAYFLSSFDWQLARLPFIRRSTRGMFQKEPIQTPGIVAYKEGAANNPNNAFSVGAEIFYELLRPGQIYTGDSRLLLQNTVFGYVASGSVDEEQQMEVFCVANRVKEIQSLTNKDMWHHCPGKDNPSDLLTRGISADSLLNCEKWWNGPSFLHEENIVAKNDDVILSDDSIYRFIDNCKQPFNKQIGPLKISEVQRAETTLVKLVQQVEFESELKDLSTKGMVSPQSKIKNLSPFLDSESFEGSSTRGWMSGVKGLYGGAPSV